MNCIGLRLPGHRETSKIESKSSLKLQNKKERIASRIKIYKFVKINSIKSYF